MKYLTTVWAKLMQLWEATQVELHGHYTVDHLHAFARYQETVSWVRACLVCALTPLPCVLTVLLVDMMPLEPATQGVLRSPRVWVRNAITVFQLAICNLEQFRMHLPRLELQRWEMVPIGLAAVAVSVGGTFVLSIVAGWYPLPFTFVIGTVPWAIVLFGMICAFKRRQLRAHKGLWGEVRSYLLVCTCQVGMTVVYPIFNYVYTSLTSIQQSASVLLLPLIKIAAKNGISHTLPDTDDAKPEAVVFNVEIFHALFVSLIMANTTSQGTIFLLMFVDLFQAWLSFRDLDHILKGTAPILDKLNRDEAAVTATIGANHELVQLVSGIALASSSQAMAVPEPSFNNPNKNDERLTQISKPWWSRLVGLRKHEVVPATVVPSAPSVTDTHVRPHAKVADDILAMKRPLVSSNSIDRDELVRRTVKALFVCEFVVLVEYVEVVMPMVYNIYVVAMYFLPNRTYYPFLDHIHSSADIFPTVANVLLYATLEFASLGLMAIVLWRKWRISVVHQLAFVLEGRASNIQAKLLHWVLDIIQTSITQLGSDYSFRFEWLREQHHH